MIDIKNIDGSVLFSVLPDDSAVFHEELMASDYVKLSWNSDVYKLIPAGAYIEYDGEKYKLLDNYTPTQQDECTYRYTPQFQSRVINWDKQITPVYTYEQDGTTVKSREMDWEFTGSPADAMYIVKQAIKNETGEEWTIQLAESLPATIRISSQSSSIFATLNTIAGECDTEWWADKKTNTLYLSKCVFGDAFKLEVGDNVQVPTVTNDSEGYFTRFYAFGSTRNITQDYNSGQATNSIVNKRLTLNPTKYPNGYKDIKSGLKKEEVFVKVLYFDDIYPSSKLTISDVRARLKYRLDNNGQKIRIGGTDSEPIYEQYAIWYFQIEGFTFDPSTDVIEGLNLSASFESGQLAGRDFELTYHKTASTVNDAADVTAFNIKAGDYEIVIDESSGTIIPGTSYIIPQDGDSLVLFNIVMPDEYVTSAQDELEKALDKAMLSYTEDNNSYQMASDPTRFYESGTDIQMGQAVTFVNGSKSLSTRVQMIEKRLDLSCYQTIKVGNKIIKGNTQQLKDEVANVNQNLDVIKAFNELSSSLSQAYANAQREMIEGFAAIKNLWKLETDEHGNKYAYTQYDVFGKGGITAYTAGKAQVPSIFDGLPLDNVTIHKNPETGLIEVIGGTGGDFDASKMWSLLGASTNEQINKSHITKALSGYATESWVTSKNYAVKATTLAGYGITDAYTKTGSDNKYLLKSSYTATDVLNKLKTVDGSGSGLDADLLDGVQLLQKGSNSGVMRSWARGTYTTVNQYFGNGAVVVIDPKPTDSNDLWDNTTIFSVGDTANRNWQMAFGYGTDTIKVRRIYNGPTYGNWETIAYLDSNVASATKLQTPRTIWGRSFDGTSNVSGNLDNVGIITGSKDIDIVGKSIVRLKYNGDDLLSVALTENSFRPFTSANNNVDLGSKAAKWRNLYLGSNAYVNGNIRVYGYVDIGTASEGSIKVNGVTILRYNESAAKNVILSSDGGTMFFRPNGTENTNGEVVVTAQGDLGIGTTSPSYKLHVNGSTYTTDMYINGVRVYKPQDKVLKIEGNLLVTGGITCYASDKRAKDIVEEISLSLKDIAESPTIRFKWNGWNIPDDGKTHLGGIAQYVQNILPECILDADGVLNMDYATTAYIYSVQTARHLRKYETKTDKKIRKLEKEIVYLKQQLKKLGYEESDTLVN